VSTVVASIPARKARPRLWTLLRRHKMATFGGALVALVAISALLAPWLSPHDPLEQNVLLRLAAPTAEFPLGNDSFGRDVLSRILWGGRVSLYVSTSAVLIAIVIGGALGILAGYIGGLFDRVVMGAMDVLLSFPTLVMGLLVVAGWFVTGFIGNDPFEPTPVASLTFIAPIADGLQYAMLSTGSTANFGIVVMAGVLVGSFFAALVTRSFHVEGYTSAHHMLRSVGGAAMMGVGGVMAFGCSIGQGLTGLSTLAFPSAIAVFGILVGAAVALRSPVRVVALASA
jgi:ABC-type dipeptide/oligopeptide/nickel transport system permease subunit